MITRVIIVCGDDRLPRLYFMSAKMINDYVVDATRGHRKAQDTRNISQGTIFDL